jgi:predicted nucleic acid-binding protein
VIVVDASLVVDFLVLAGRDPKLSKLMAAQASETFAPALLDLEVMQVLRRLAQRRAMDQDQASACIGVLQDLRIKRQPHRPFLKRIWQLRHTLTAYDAAYVALAEGLEAPLFTRDRKLAAAGGHTARIEVISR